ncbi:Protein of unknown function [Pseudobutyrivibrio sp. C4]|jgi:hypothetical protein|uniref:DUF1292 domain-containing protein n=1 Tax=Pseudobutyrivibrio TaxID=46205 RepID=UPI0008D0A6F8|nr:MULTISPECIES: DUF1292 domain-containing protein [Pseudobutyrivibrio]MBE5912561.1 DUF1292 domain-containing protein [Pseudobutyrivibrio ruminis]SES67535.1 Protein of unknown function [Pseudobutyrivibrio sp. C4]
MEQIILSGADGEDLPVYVIEETQLSGVKYLLVCDSQDENEDADAFILKEVSEDNGEVIYDVVEDDVEFDAVAKLFEELVGDEADIDY